jgi:thioredoxin-related protein
VSPNPFVIYFLKKEPTMKYHLILIAFLASILSLHAHTIEEDPHFKALLSKGLLNHKYALMFYRAKSCPQCAYMKEKVFTNPMRLRQTRRGNFFKGCFMRERKIRAIL